MIIRPLHLLFLSETFEEVAREPRVHQHRICKLELPQEVPSWGNPAPRSVGEGQRYELNGLSCLLVTYLSVKRIQ